MDSYRELKFVYLLEKPYVPLYLGPRGNGERKCMYNMPEDYLQQHEKEALFECRKAIPPTTRIVEVPIYYPTKQYNLKVVQESVPKNSVFSSMDREHLKASFELTNILLGQETEDDFLGACALTRDSVNIHLWIHAFSRAVMKRPDMKDIRLPAIWETMPDYFIESPVWQRAVQESSMPQHARAIIVVDKSFSGTDLDPNHKVAYFREDLGINSHHWHWHQLYPSLLPKGEIERKGELFYYMHHNVQARYEAECLSNGLNRPVMLDFHTGLMEEGYFPKLTLQTSAIKFSDRQANTVLKDFKEVRDSRRKFAGPGSLATIRAWFDRIIEAIDFGFAVEDGGRRISLRTDQGIDVLAAMMESSNDSPNMNYYGIAHNYGHSAIARAHDPDSSHKSPPGVMYLASTSIRDPIFFRYHKYIDVVFKRQKDYLPPYSTEKLAWNGVILNSIEMVRTEPNLVPTPNLDMANKMVTHWMQSDVELSRGIDFGRTNINGLGSVWVRVTHLQHVPFRYRIRATNQTPTSVEAVVRIFMAPKLDENGDKLPFYQQRVMFFEMDKFRTTLQPGENIIVQESKDSTLTIPWEQTFRDIERDSETLTRKQAVRGCGWPAHMLLPRGSKGGTPFDLFVMITNAQVDQVPGARRQVGSPAGDGANKDSISYCGLVDDKFPDALPMGYPFDRPAFPDEWSKPNTFLSDFVRISPNMGTVEVLSFHVDKTVYRGNGAPIGIREVKVTP